MVVFQTVEDQVGAVYATSDAKTLVARDQGKTARCFPDTAGGGQQLADKGTSSNRTVPGNVVADVFEIALGFICQDDPHR